jgi:hypothetical protein
MILFCVYYLYVAVKVCFFLSLYFLAVDVELKSNNLSNFEGIH